MAEIHEVIYGAGECANLRGAILTKELCESMNVAGSSGLHLFQVPSDTEKNGNRNQRCRLTVEIRAGQLLRNVRR